MLDTHRPSAAPDTVEVVIVSRPVPTPGSVTPGHTGTHLTAAPIEATVHRATVGPHLQRDAVPVRIAASTRAFGGPDGVHRS